MPSSTPPATTEAETEERYQEVTGKGLVGYGRRQELGGIKERWRKPSDLDWLFGIFVFFE